MHTDRAFHVRFNGSVRGALNHIRPVRQACSLTADTGQTGSRCLAQAALLWWKWYFMRLRHHFLQGHIGEFLSDNYLWPYL